MELTMVLGINAWGVTMGHNGLPLFIDRPADIQKSVQIVFFMFLKMGWYYNLTST